MYHPQALNRSRNRCLQPSLSTTFGVWDACKCPRIDLQEPAKAANCPRMYRLKTTRAEDAGEMSKGTFDSWVSDSCRLEPSLTILAPTADGDGHGDASKILFLDGETAFDSDSWLVRTEQI